MQLKQIRAQRGLSQEQLAKAIGVSRSTIAMWETGGSQPDAQMLLKLSSLVGVSIDVLLGNSAQVPHKVNVYGDIPAGVPVEAIEDVLGQIEVEADTLRDGYDYFALRLKGDSMVPEYRHGDVVLFRKSPSARAGEDVAAMIGEQDATFKRFTRSDTGIVLRPLNPDYEPLFFSKEQIARLPVVILGVAVEMRRTLA